MHCIHLQPGVLHSLRLRFIPSRPFYFVCLEICTLFPVPARLLLFAPLISSSSIVTHRSAKPCLPSSLAAPRRRPTPLASRLIRYARYINYFDLILFYSSRIFVLSQVSHSILAVLFLIGCLLVTLFIVTMHSSSMRACSCYLFPPLLRRSSSSGDGHRTVVAVRSAAAPLVRRSVPQQAVSDCAHQWRAHVCAHARFA